MGDLISFYFVIAIGFFVLYWSFLMGDEKYHGPQNITELFTHLTVSIVWNILWPLTLVIFVMSWREVDNGE